MEDKETRKPYDREEKMGWRVAHHAREQGVLIRPLGNVIVIMPPLAISEQNLAHMMNVMKETIRAATGA